MAKTTGDVIVEKLIDWGVDTAFGLPGDGINGIFEALRKNREKIRFIQCRHEEAAAFAACGYAKFTGPAGRLLRHQRPRRHPSLERPLRRQARPRPGPGHHRAHLPRPDRHVLPAGNRHPRSSSATSRRTTR